MKTTLLHTTYNLISRLTLLLSLIILFIMQGVAQTTVPFTASGTWTVPAGVTIVKVECWGGGGAGGGANGSAPTNRAGGGGAGGAYTLVNTISVSPGQIISVTVGAGGIGNYSNDNGGNPGNGGNGGTSVFNSIIPVSAIGGEGGKEGFSGDATGAGGVTTTGGTFNGGAGASGSTASNYSGGGGGGAGNGSSGSASTNYIGGSGGSGAIAGGNGANGLNNTQGDGITSNTLSGGGSGGRTTQDINRKGGDGFRGQVVITYTTCDAPSISTPPINQTANVGGSATFSVTATGTGLIYQWRKGTCIISGAIGASYTLDPVAISDAATDYNLVITGSCGTVISGYVTLTINAQPIASVTNQSNLSCFASADGTITVEASGGSGTGYTFSKDNGATYVTGPNPYTFTGLSAGIEYKVRVKDSNGSQSPVIP